MRARLELRYGLDAETGTARFRAGPEANAHQLVSVLSISDIENQIPVSPVAQIVGAFRRLAYQRIQFLEYRLVICQT
jgi:hypothetical protein